MAYTLKKITPVLMVEAIEPCLPFWDRLGFTKVAEDVAAIAESPMGGTMLFVEVDDLAAVIKAVGSAPVTFPRRTTFYGMDEVGVREPGGNPVTFAMAVKT